MNSIYRSRDFVENVEFHGGGQHISKLYTFIGLYDNSTCQIFKNTEFGINEYFDLENAYFTGKYYKSENETWVLVGEYSGLNKGRIEIEFLFKNNQKNLEIVFSKFNNLMGDFQIVDIDIDQLEGRVGKLIESSKIYNKDGSPKGKNIIKGSIIVVTDNNEHFLKFHLMNNPKHTGWIPKDAVKMWSLDPPQNPEP